ncbi:MAG: UvrD-helicase domain-containing protein [Bryobacteraceae bacterium]
MTPRLVPAFDDRPDRLRAIDPTGSFIVQAPAGSGKTELLVQRFLALLARVEQPESILAITFTVKAAGEMRARVLAALERCEAGEPDTAHGAATVELARAAMARDRAAGWELLSNPARLRIQTIDALCASIVQRMPWMARFGSMPGVTEDATLAYREAARQTLRRLGEDDSLAGAARTLILHLDGDWRKAQKMIETILPKRDQWLRHLGTGADPLEVRAALETTLGALVERHLASLRALVPPRAEKPAAHLLKFLYKTAGELPSATGAALPDWIRLADLTLTQQGEWRQSIRGIANFPAYATYEKRLHADLIRILEPHAELRAVLHETRQLPSPHFSEQQWSLMCALLCLLPAAAAELKLAFRERSEVDFVEVAEAARRALAGDAGPSDLALALGHRIEHVLVDEMQDTSVTQVELFERLTASWDASEGRTLFLVGDPMQSIYRFREADVGLFLRIRERGLGDLAVEPLTLRSNFRSRPEIVDWVNAAFAKIFPDTDDATVGAVRYSKSQAQRGADAAAGLAIHPFYGLDEAAEAARVADIVRDAKEGHTAILVRARQHATAIVRELGRRGIAFRAVDLDPLAERPVIADLTALTRAVLHPADRTAWLSLLRAPWCGLTRAELFTVAGGNPRQPVWDLLTTLEDPRIDRFKAAMSAALEDARRIPLRRCVERTWLALGGEACLDDSGARADAERFFALLEQLDSGGDLASFQLLDDAVAQLFAQPDPRAPESLQIMTIHKAKGLEFDTVIVPGLGRGPAVDDPPLLRWAEIPLDGAEGLVFAPVEAAEADRDPVYRYLGRLDRQRLKHESARLLYVAATRARERLHLLGHAETAAGKIKPRAGSLLEIAWPAIEQHFVQAHAAESAAPPAAAKPATTLRRLPLAWTPPAGISPVPPEEPEERVSFEWVGDTLRHVGTVVHAWLARIAREGLAQWPPSRLLSERNRIRAALESLGIIPSEADGAASQVLRAMQLTLEDERGRWILGERPGHAVESAAAAAIDGFVRHSVVDRTFVEHGVRWVIDFKTSTLEGSGLDEFLDNEQARYSARMEHYRKLYARLGAEPVRLGLYFPLLGGWREW